MSLQILILFSGLYFDYLGLEHLVEGVTFGSFGSNCFCDLIYLT